MKDKEEKIFDEKIGKTIQTERRNKGYSRQQVEELTGISHTSLYEIENGQKGFSVYRLKLLSQLFGVTSDYLINGEQSNLPTKKIRIEINGLSVERGLNLENIYISTTEL